MAIWIEIKCDLRREGRDPHRHLMPFCFSNSNANPSGWSVPEAKAGARAAGWTIAPHGMAACPNCASDTEPFFYPDEQDPTA